MSKGYLVQRSKNKSGVVVYEDYVKTYMGNILFVKSLNGATIFTKEEAGEVLDHADFTGRSISVDELS
ncbi:hypothetical protein NVP1063O_103 [Vibrio phage 1.063.O._10N.261.45.C7]|nr:hypothetical protein NVP1063O_103 [Vibrio phage 1.063.O._10N.261.45.C7]